MSLKLVGKSIRACNSKPMKLGMSFAAMMACCLACAQAQQTTNPPQQGPNQSKYPQQKPPTPLPTNSVTPLQTVPPPSTGLSLPPVVKPLALPMPFQHPLPGQPLLPDFNRWVSAVDFQSMQKWFHQYLTVKFKGASEGDFQIYADIMTMAYIKEINGAAIYQGRTTKFDLQQPNFDPLQTQDALLTWAFGIVSDPKTAPSDAQFFARFVAVNYELGAILTPNDFTMDVPVQCHLFFGWSRTPDQDTDTMFQFAASVLTSDKIINASSVKLVSSMLDVLTNQVYLNRTSLTGVTTALATPGATAHTLAANVLPGYGSAPVTPNYGAPVQGAPVAGSVPPGTYPAGTVAPGVQAPGAGTVRQVRFRRQGQFLQEHIPRAPFHRQRRQPEHILLARFRRRGQFQRERIPRAAFHQQRRQPERILQAQFRQRGQFQREHNLLRARLRLPMARLRQEPLRPAPLQRAVPVGVPHSRCCRQTVRHRLSLLRRGCPRRKSARVGLRLDLSFWRCSISEMSRRYSEATDCCSCSFSMQPKTPAPLGNQYGQPAPPQQGMGGNGNGQQGNGQQGTGQTGTGQTGTGH